MIPDPRSLLDRFRQAEVEDLHGAVVAYFDVGWLQIAVDDPARVSFFQCIRDLPGDRECVIEWNRTVRNPVGKRDALDKLHH